MEAESVSASDLSRIWLIEFLSDCKEASASLLNVLIQKTPALLDPLAKNARERVSLRCLEDLVGFNAARDVAPTLGSKADIALSESCQDVFQRVASKVPMSNLRDARSKLSEWNLDLFIMHKRASLPKCVLQQLKDAEARLSFPLNLEEEGEATNSNANRGVTDMNVMNSEIVVNEVPGKNLLPSEREELVGENAAEHINENLGVDNVDGLHPNTNKLRGKSLSSSLAEDRNAFILHGDETLGELPTQVRQCCVNICDGFVSSMKLTKKSTVDDCENQPIPLQDNVSGDGYPEVVSIHDAKDDRDPAVTDLQMIFRDNDSKELRHNLQGRCRNDSPSDLSCGNPTAGELKNSVDQCAVPDSESESDDYHDEEADIASKKRRFLSQCTLRSRSLETNYLTEATLCMKCNSNRSGRLLVCSSSSCPLVVHEDCLGSSASFSDLGNFYCPFCSYSHAILEYRAAKRKNSLARKELSAFTGVGIKRRRKRLSRLYSSEQDQLRNGNVEECGHSNNSGHRNFVNPHCRSTEDELMADGHTAVRNLINGETYSRSFDLQNGATENTVQADGHHQREISENGQKSNECAHESNIIYDGGYRKELDPLHGVQQADEQVKEYGLATSDHVKTVTSHPRSNKDTHATSCVDRKGEGSAISRAGCVGTELNGRVGNAIQELASEKVVAGSQRKVMGVVTRQRCQEMPYTYPAISCLRRRNLAWTAAEVEILKDGVRRFSENSDKGIPWKEILEFGKSVFEKGRTTVDLKDKWRNICKASGKSR